MVIAVEAAGLSKYFRAPGGGTVRAVDRVSLQIRAGQVLGLVGAPGAGKTTLLRLIGGELKPTRGHICEHVSAILLDEPGPATEIPPGATAVIATGDLSVALALCQEIALMDRGRVLAPRSAGPIPLTGSPSPTCQSVTRCWSGRRWTRRRCTGCSHACGIWACRWCR